MQLALDEDRLFILRAARCSAQMRFIIYAVCSQDPNTIFYVMPFHLCVHDAAAVARDRIAEMAYA